MYFIKEGERVRLFCMNAYTRLYKRIVAAKHDDDDDDHDDKERKKFNRPEGFYSHKIYFVSRTHNNHSESTKNE